MWARASAQRAVAAPRARARALLPRFDVKFPSGVCDPCLMRTKESVAELARPITAANARYNIERGARAGSGEHLRVCQRSRRRRQEGGDGGEEEHCTAAVARISDERSTSCWIELSSLMSTKR